ncbi:transposase [Okeania sp. SIO2C2]|uniref:transposase n=1 Tax=Okeania sp. SIO2C2 TaxID=2607787 RepID=UPI00257FE84A|nr:transposase [Okeania sp. SIO2C2]
MGRPKREFKADYSYHITTRCNNRDFNLTRRETREILLHIIKQAQEKYPFKLYALCIMLNHVHYLMEAENPVSLRAERSEAFAEHSRRESNLNRRDCFITLTLHSQ